MGNFRGVDRWRSDRKHPGDRRHQSWRPNKPEPVTKTSDSVWISESGVVNREENNGRNYTGWSQNNGRNYTGWSQNISSFTIPYCEAKLQDTRFKPLKTKLSGFFFYRCAVHSEIYVVHSATNTIFINLVKSFKFTKRCTIIALLYVSVSNDHHQGALSIPN